MSSLVTFSRESLHPLALLAMREAGAQGYALFRQTPEGELILLSASGIPITKEEIAGGPGLQVASFPLRTGEHITGQLAFAFAGRALTPAARSRLCRLAAAIGQVWQLPETVSALAGVAVRIGELEAELADSKIATRTRGFLEGSGEAADLVEIVTRHVQSVLGRFESGALLERRRQELEAEIEERNIAAEAKAVLQATNGLTEDAAHLRLRRLSRETRRPLREVALEVIANARGDTRDGPEPRLRKSA